MFYFLRYTLIRWSGFKSPKHIANSNFVAENICTFWPDETIGNSNVFFTDNVSIFMLFKIQNHFCKLLYIDMLWSINQHCFHYFILINFRWVFKNISDFFTFIIHGQHMLEISLVQRVYHLDGCNYFYAIMDFHDVLVVKPYNIGVHLHDTFSLC